ncbi:MAG: RNA polymerase sigma factor [Phycisphaerales bacterium]
MNADRGTNSSNLSADDEAALVVRAQAGDRDAVTELLESLRDRLYSVCFRMVSAPEDAADLTQDALTKVLMNLNRYDGRAAFSTWAYRIAMNTSLSHLRRRKTRSAHVWDDAPVDLDRIHGEPRGGGGESGEPGSGSRVEWNERRRGVLEALARLPDEARALLILRDVRGLDYRQIAEVLESPVGTVKSRLFRARLALRRELEAGGDTGTNEALAPVSDESGQSST